MISPPHQSTQSSILQTTVIHGTLILAAASSPETEQSTTSTATTAGSVIHTVNCSNPNDTPAAIALLIVQNNQSDCTQHEPLYYVQVAADKWNKVKESHDKDSKSSQPEIPKQSPTSASISCKAEDRLLAGFPSPVHMQRHIYKNDQSLENLMINQPIFTTNEREESAAPPCITEDRLPAEFPSPVHMQRHIYELENMMLNLAIPTVNERDEWESIPMSEQTEYGLDENSRLHLLLTKAITILNKALAAQGLQNKITSNCNIEEIDTDASDDIVDIDDSEDTDRTRTCPLTYVETTAISINKPSYTQSKTFSLLSRTLLNELNLLANIPNATKNNSEKVFKARTHIDQINILFEELFEEVDIFISDPYCSNNEAYMYTVSQIENIFSTLDQYMAHPENVRNKSYTCIASQIEALIYKLHTSLTNHDSTLNATQSCIADLIMLLSNRIQIYITNMHKIGLATHKDLVVEVKQLSNTLQTFSAATHTLNTTEITSAEFNLTLINQLLAVYKKLELTH